MWWVNLSSGVPVGAAGEGLVGLGVPSAPTAGSAELVKQRMAEEALERSKEMSVSIELRDSRAFEAALWGWVGSGERLGGERTMSIAAAGCCVVKEMSGELDCCVVML